jgi:glycosyltransferase involved in cell wall biosynthesis
MRVLHATELADGGVAVYVRRISRVQRAEGLAVSELTPSGCGHSGLPPWRLRRRDPARWWSARAQLIDAIDETRPDVVHAHSFFAGAVARSLPMRARRGAAVVYQPHAWAVDAVASAPARSAIGRWEATAGRRTDAIAYVSADEQRQGAGLGVRSPGYLVGVPVDLEEFRPPLPGERELARQRLGLGSGPVAVCVGRLSRQKGQDLLASAWERAASQGITMALVGAGDPDAVAVCAPTAFGRSLLHVGPTDDVLSWLHAADAIVQSSRYEGMSTAVGEALAAGRPVFSTSVNGAREAIESDLHGPRAGAVEDDVDGVLHRLRAALESPADLEAYAAAARARAESLYDIGLVERRIGAVYRAAVAGRRR